MSKTHIQWTERTWNPIAGCSVVSPGCKNCYAMRDAHRLARNPHPKIAAKYAGTTRTVKGKPVWTGVINLADEHTLTLPLRTRKPAMWFVNSMSDLFHENVPDELIDRVFAVMALCVSQSPSRQSRSTPLAGHTFQLLTKRSARMREYMSSPIVDGRIIVAAISMLPTDWRESETLQWGSLRLDDKADTWHLDWPLSNVWLGVSVEDQTRADERIPDLLATPAAIRFISAEPLLGSVDLSAIPLDHDMDVRSGKRSLASLTPNQILDWHQRRLHVTPTINALGDKALMATNPGHEFAFLDWVIVGGESGSGARPMHPGWARLLRDQCASVGVPFFFKQWGEWAPNIGAVDGWELGDDPEISRFDHREWENGQWGEVFRPMWCDFSDGNYDEEQCVSRIGTKRAGRLLDGVEHNAMPQTPPNFAQS